jgi:hypothetical protein
MECSNRAFYELKDKILEIVGTLTNYWVWDCEEDYIWNKISEKCDYEWDLEWIQILNDKETEELISKLIEDLKIEDKIPEWMNIIFTIFPQK